MSREGVVPLLKPPGLSSSDCVVDVRRLFGEKRVGHLGTLDPGAAGILPVCVGRAVRLFDYLVDKEKTYRFELILGTATDTQDSFGQVIETGARDMAAAEIEAILPRFRGDIEQLAPAYSALKSNGQKLYDLALQGKAVPEKRRPVTIRELTLLRQEGEGRFLLEMTCSRGTYVRTVCHDLGHALGTCGHMGSLLRTRSGPFTVERSFTVEELKTLREEDRLGEALVSCEAALIQFPELTLPKDRLIPTKNGLPTDLHGPDRRPDGPLRLYCDGAFLGIGKVEQGRVKLAVHLYE
ncbi:MAG: tRNA pseudouridine(55) synthase TruB [Clostridia bacterium]|nr:tRNA pseudouridine(55) synthase TruB [Clostridia bacterium]